MEKNELRSKGKRHERKIKNVFSNVVHKEYEIKRENNQIKSVEEPKSVLRFCVHRSHSIAQQSSRSSEKKQRPTSPVCIRCKLISFIISHQFHCTGAFASVRIVLALRFFYTSSSHSIACIGNAKRLTEKKANEGERERWRMGKEDEELRMNFCTSSNEHQINK